MIIQNIHNPKVVREISRKEWESLGKSQKVFKILDEKDSPAVKEQTIYNMVGKKETIKPGEEKLSPKKDKTDLIEKKKSK